MKLRRTARTEHMTDVEIEAYEKWITASLGHPIVQASFRDKLHEAVSDLCRAYERRERFKAEGASEAKFDPADDSWTYWMKIFIAVIENEVFAAERECKKWSSMMKKPHRSAGGDAFDAKRERARNYPICDLLRSEGFATPNPSSFFFVCPFHDEKSASFKVFKEDNHAHCFGCGFHGDSIEVVMKLKDLKFKEAVEYLNGLT